MRKEILLTDSLMDLMMTMSEGNPGAINVIMSLLKERPDDGMMLLLHLDDMNIRGTQIWIGFKDHCHEQINNFVQCIKNRSPEMVSVINDEGIRGNHKEKAVTSGASKPGSRQFL
jgi:hypothetical protein